MEICSNHKQVTFIQFMGIVNGGDNNFHEHLPP